MFTLIVLAYNEEKYIEKTIKESFNHFDEVIIVNDSSKDETLNKINKLELQDFNNLKIINFSPSNIAIDKETVMLPELKSEIIVEKIPVDITLRGSFLNFNKFLEMFKKCLSFSHQPSGLGLFSVFSMPSWIDFWWIFDPNLHPKIHQNPSKIDARMPSHVDLPF